MLGNGDGTFKTFNSSLDHSSAGTLALGDYNGDGKLDVAVGELRGTVSLLLGSGDGALQSTLTLSLGLGVGGGSESVAVSDFNGDGKSDLVVAHIYHNSVTVLLNTSTFSGVGLSTVRHSDTLSVSWPLQSSGFVLESSTSLSLTNWQPAVEALTTNYGRLEVTVPLNQSQRFFRLHKL